MASQYRPRKKTNPFWGVLPEGYCGPGPGGQMWCRFPLKAPPQGEAPAVDAEKCDWAKIGNLKTLVGHLNRHSAEFPDICAAAIKAYEGQLA